MSIRAIKLNEVKEIMSQTLGSKILKRKNLDQRNEIRLALNAVLLANRSAVLFTYGTVPKEMYGEELRIREINLLDVISKPANPGQIYLDLENLLHNCISEGGTDFMPQRYRQVIEDILHQLRLQVGK